MTLESNVDEKGQSHGHPPATTEERATEAAAAAVKDSVHTCSPSRFSLRPL